jgi:UDP-glucose 4-epimerase
MKILISGGTGYVGSHVMTELLAHAHELFVIDDLSNSHHEVIERINDQFSATVCFQEMDLLDKRKLFDCLARVKPDIVVHCAAKKSVPESIEIPFAYYENNIFGTLNLLQAMQRVGCRRMIFSSSSTVYGEYSGTPFSEDHQTDPINPYGCSKLFSERLIGDWCRTDPMNAAVILRYFNPVGAHPSGIIGECSKGKFKNIFPILAEHSEDSDRVFEIFGSDLDTHDGTCVRDYLHVQDLAAAHINSIELLNTLEGVEIFNLGLGKGYSVLEIINAFNDHIPNPIKYQFVPRRNGDAAISYCSVQKAKSILNWVAKRELSDMCVDELNWKGNNPKGYLS